MTNRVFNSTDIKEQLRDEPQRQCQRISTKHLEIFEPKIFANFIFRVLLVGK